jgi:hypothetical protein
MPPGMPPERAAAIRRAFELTMQDAGFLAEATKGKLDVAPLTGGALQAIVMRSFAVSPEVLATAKKAME